MQIRHVSIKNFRGIQKMDWSIRSQIVCLVGAGDSTKSTILDAIDFALSPRWNLSFEDCDFYLENTDDPIEIIVTIGQLPSELITHEKFGLETRGWNKQDGLRDETGDDEPVLSIRLIIDKSLEPQWAVINDRNQEGHTISSKDREKLGTSRLGAFIDKHLYWGQGSALSNLTTDRKENAAPMITEAHRKARDEAKIEDIEVFQTAAARTEKIAKELGFKPKEKLRPALDPKAINIGLGAITIHDGNIPLRLTGLGSRRLIALGIQLSCVEDGSLLLIDEVENGLEPHRIRHLLKYLQRTINMNPDKAGQVIMTSHSSTSIVELSAENLYIVRSINGETIVNNVSQNLQNIVRKAPEAFLGIKTVVCEGKTELGILRIIEDYWINQKNREPLAHNGVVLIHGGGDDAPKTAFELANLGYTICFFADGDKLDQLNPPPEDLHSKGIGVFHWSKPNAIEQILANDLSWIVLKKMVDLGVESKGEQSVYDTIWNKLGRANHPANNNLDNWLANDIPEEDIRKAIGESAKEKGWFKRIDYGENLGRLIIEDLPSLVNKETTMVLDQIEGWIYA